MFDWFLVLDIRTPPNAKLTDDEERAKCARLEKVSVPSFQHFSAQTRTEKLKKLGTDTFLAQ